MEKKSAAWLYYFLAASSIISWAFAMLGNPDLLKIISSIYGLIFLHSEQSFLQ